MLKIVKKMRPREIILILICIALICVQVYLDLCLPEFVRKLTVMITNMADTSEILAKAFQMLLCVLSSATLSVVCGYLSARCAAGYCYSLRDDLFHKVMEFGEEETLRFSVPSLITRTTNDITQIQTLISMGLQIAVKSPIMAVWAICKLVGKSWDLTAVVAVFVFVVIAGVLVVMYIVLPKFRQIQKLTDQINLVIRENLTGINVVHAFNAEEYQNEKFEKVNEGITRKQLFNQRVFSGLQPIIEFANNTLTFTIYWVGAILLMSMGAEQHVAFFGDIVAFTLYATNVLMAFMMMVMIFMMFPPALASAERIAKVLYSDVKIKPGSEDFSIDNDTVMEFKDVYFKYPSAQSNMLKDITFDLKKGQTLAIIGPTGSGKTTLVNLMMRFYDPSSGIIKINGKKIQDYSFESLYDNITMATQKPVIFQGSVEDNIRFGNKEKSMSKDKVDEAIKISQSNDVIEKLKDGKKSIISQGGKDISGGQKQRISIARTIARDPKILIMDDTFSALDYKTDAALRKELSTKLKDTTCVIVAQRIGTIRYADKILVMENGKIVGIGNHQELLKTCKTYQEIAISQLRIEELV